jgi:hypothetical protein
MVDACCVRSCPNHAGTAALFRKRLYILLARNASIVMLELFNKSVSSILKG